MDINSKEANREMGQPAKLTAWYSGDGREAYPALLPFAWDERMCGEVGRSGQPALHIWRHPAAFVVGLRDRRLPHAEEAMAELRQRGIEAIVRNSGGAAVPLDPGVVNLSLVLPNPTRTIDFRDDFLKMVELIRRALAPWTAGVEDGEIGGSYCPGDFDLSIGGRKFCGIAQRRQTNGYVIQAFLNIEGEGRERAALVQSFYERAGRDAAPGAYPDVQEGRMASLTELIGPITADEFVASVLDVVVSGGGQVERTTPERLLTPDLAETIKKLRQRYDR
ncbi:hypothetical protein J31TS4_08290 [Paenibacillus sp. J31TS4]|uniref:lipoate--protein ligase family protein n=1 Tax=Paenibacillus sp. J31TS4 TaxID=2807195 RepID=UPI001AFE6EA1|nr:lipoate--protein ligase family protein [Paenibacillus sp. J31TS4]GIP37549.1 hypothetical protein J31TS4_08290 [Paenibacillus sp. J31TS4]